jgi:hypothetical protein
MSPVITNVSGRPPASVKRTVVSSVFGKQFSNSQASSGSATSRRTAAIADSTASLRNRRSPTGGRRVGRSGAPAARREPGASAEAAARAAVRRAWRRVVIVSPRPGG